MPARRLVTLSLPLLGLALLGVSSPANAQPPPAQDLGLAPQVKACLDATEEGQRLRDSGAYLRARQRFIACAAERCPGEVRKSCVGWLEDLDKLVPTVVFAASAHGGDVTDVRVSVDGTVVAERIDGKPVALDPGEHSFRFERAGEPTIEQRIVLRAGEKERVLPVRFEPEPAATPPPPIPSPRPAPAPPSAAFYAFGALSLAALATGAALDVTGYVFLQQCDGDASCSGSHERAEVQWRFVTGDLLLAAGVASGVVAWLLRPRDPHVGPDPVAAGVGAVGIVPTAHGASLRAAFTF
jgi:hypothetical protein